MKKLSLQLVGFPEKSHLLLEQYIDLYQKEIRLVEANAEVVMLDLDTSTGRNARADFKDAIIIDASEERRHASQIDFFVKKPLSVKALDGCFKQVIAEAKRPKRNKALQPTLEKKSVSFPPVPPTVKTEVVSDLLSQFGKSRH